MAWMEPSRWSGKWNLWEHETEMDMKVGATETCRRTQVMMEEPSRVRSAFCRTTLPPNLTKVDAPWDNLQKAFTDLWVSDDMIMDYRAVSLCQNNYLFFINLFYLLHIFCLQYMRSKNLTKSSPSVFPLLIFFIHHGKGITSTIVSQNYMEETFLSHRIWAQLCVNCSESCFFNAVLSSSFLFSHFNGLFLNPYSMANHPYFPLGLTFVTKKKYK